MNKDVVYIEPEDDITDIINRVKNTEKKIVALVPPKKLGVMRSSINLKLLAKTANQEDKAIVIITTDEALQKLSVTSGLPYAKSLSSRPVMPVEEQLEEQESSEDDSINEEDNKEESEDTKSQKEDTEKSQEDDIELDSDNIDDEDSKKSKKSKNKDAKKNGILSKIPNFDKYRKYIVIGGVAFVVLIGFLIWAFAFAPFTKIIVDIKTTPTSLSENVTLVTDQDKSKPEEGIFLLEQVKYEDEDSIEFEATGEENRGEKASGNVTFSAAFTSSDASSLTIPAGTAIMANNLNYYTDNAVTLANPDECTKQQYNSGSCVASGSTGVTAEKAGEKYNQGSTQNWQVSIAGVTAVSTPMAGGSDHIVKVVTKGDIEKASSSLSNSASKKESLTQQINTNEMAIIDSSYKVETKDPVSSPEEGKEIEDGKKAKLTAKTIYLVYVVDKAQIEKFIKAKIGNTLASDQKIYSTGNPFFERFIDNDGTYSAKLKTTYKTGPEVTESMVMEKSKGKKIGEVQTLIKSINGVSDVKVDASYPWVTSIPGDENKISIEIKVEE